jgi:hypothetical protein
MYGKRIYLTVFFLIFLTPSFLNANSSPIVANVQTSTTTVYIDPQLTVTQTNVTFSVNVSITEVNDLCSWQVYVYYKKEILEAVSYAEGPFLQSHGPTMFDGSFDNNYNSTHGELWMYCLRTWTGHGVDGYGTLATASFKAKLVGTSSLALANTILGNQTAQRISHVTADGLVQVGANIAIISVVPDKTIVGQACPMNINVTVKNQGDRTVTFNLTVCANSSIVEKQTVTLESSRTKSVSFTWDTRGFAKGNYTISAYVTSDHIFVDGWVMVTIVGDVDWNFEVDIYDITAICMCYGSKRGESVYHAEYDLDNTGEIDIFDVTGACVNYGQKDP